MDEHTPIIQLVASKIGTRCTIKVKAGPGSGKTTLLAQICAAHDEYKIVAAAVTKASVEEMLGRDEIKTNIKTLHSSGNTALNEHYNLNHGQDARDMRGEVDASDSDELSLYDPELVKKVRKNGQTNFILLQHMLKREACPTAH